MRKQKEGCVTWTRIKEKAEIRCLIASRTLPPDSASHWSILLHWYPALLLNIAEKWSKLQDSSSCFSPSLFSLPVYFLPQIKGTGVLLSNPFFKYPEVLFKCLLHPLPSFSLSHTLLSSILVAFSFTKTVIIVSVNKDDSSMFQIIAEAQHEKFTSNPTH